MFLKSIAALAVMAMVSVSATPQAYAGDREARQAVGAMLMLFGTALMQQGNYHKPPKHRKHPNYRPAPPPRVIHVPPPPPRVIYMPPPPPRVIYRPAPPPRVIHVPPHYKGPPATCRKHKGKIHCYRPRRH